MSVFNHRHRRHSIFHRICFAPARCTAFLLPLLPALLLLVFAPHPLLPALLPALSLLLHLLPLLPVLLPLLPATPVLSLHPLLP